MGSLHKGRLCAPVCTSIAIVQSSDTLLNLDANDFFSCTVMEPKSHMLEDTSPAPNSLLDRILRFAHPFCSS